MTKLMGLDALLKLLDNYLPVNEVAVIKKAYEFSYAAHSGQRRVSGEDYIIHPLAVAYILANLKADYESICAALLHDVLEDTSFSKADIKREFGIIILKIVDGITKIQQFQRKTDLTTSKAENFQKLILSASKDTRIIIVKLADRLHNLRTIKYLKREKQIKIASETLELYVPLARRLGIHNICDEIEELCFSIIYPYRHFLLVEYLKKNEARNINILEEIKQSLKNKAKNLKIPVEIFYRQKTPYSIYKKLQYKLERKSDEPIGDIYALKIITDDVDSCYRILGIAHNSYKPVKGLLKDYIAIPKETGYQALHTVLMNQKGIIFELQIKTKAMDAVASYGIASHWAYKNKWSLNTIIQAQALFSRLSKLETNASTFENMKTTINHNDIYVFSPKGEIINLPIGATSLDFAYAIHSYLGQHFSYAQINGEIQTKISTLKTGDTIKIFTDESTSPSIDWLNKCTTTKAISSINEFLNKQAEPVESHAILTEKLAKFDYTLTNTSFGKLACKIANCCLPIKDDPIIAYIGNNGVSIHRTACSHASSLSKQAIFPMKWGNFDDELLTSLSIKVETYYKDILSSLANALLLKDILIEQISILDDETSLTHTINVRFYVKNRLELSEIIKYIRSTIGTAKITRKIF